jgi:hypothetical protein
MIAKQSTQGGFGRRMGLQEGQAQSKYSEFVNEREEMVMRLKEKFEKTDELSLGGGKLDSLFEANPRKAANLVMFLEQTERAAFNDPVLTGNLNTQRALTEARLREDIQSSGFLSMTPMDIVKVARIGYPNSVSPDLFDFWGMGSMKDSIYKLETLYGSTARGATKDTVLYENYNDGRYQSEYEKEVITTAVQKIFTGTLDQHPLRPFKVYVYLNGYQVGTDDGNGTVVGPGVLDPAATNTVNYTSGDFTITFLANLATTDDLYIEYAYDSEQQTLFGNVGSILLDLVVYDYRATPWPLVIEWTRFTEELMQSKLGLSAKDALITGAANAFRKGMDEFCIAKAIGAAKWTTPITFDTDFAAAGSDSSVEHAQAVLQAIANAEMKSYGALGRLPDKTNLMVDYPAYVYLTKHRLFNSVNAPSKIGIFKVGTLDSRDVYVAPPNVMASESNKGKVYCFGKGNDNMNIDAVVSVGTWKASVTTNPVELKNFNSQMGMAFYGDIRKNNVKFATSLELTNLTPNS